MAQIDLSVVIPTLNAATHLKAILDALQVDHAALRVEIIVADGDSSDGTASIARTHGSKVINVERGRGRQLHAGASVAVGTWLLFLHGDTRVASNWLQIVTEFVRTPGNTLRVAAFRLALDDDSDAARRLERLVAWRCSRFRLPYGDQGLLVSRQMYQEIGGYYPLPFLEDVDLVRRIGRSRIVMLDAVAMTSSERYRRSGYLRQGIRNIVLVALFFGGLSPERLTRFYR